MYSVLRRAFKLVWLVSHGLKPVNESTLKKKEKRKIIVF